MQHNHFYIQKKHIVPPPIGNYPMYLTNDSFDCLGWGEDCSFNEACVHETREKESAQALKESSVQLHRQTIEVLNDFVRKNLLHYGVAEINIENAIPYVLEHIPVYLVFSDQKYEHTSLTSENKKEGLQVPPDSWNCIDISIDVLEKWLDDESLDIVRKRDGVLLGMYQGKVSMDSKTQKETANRMVFLTVDDIHNSLSPKNCNEPLTKASRIFLWVDHIKEAAIDNGCSYESLFFQVLCHEFMHALMDVYSGECLQIDGASGCEKEIYYEYREESLANGLSLYLLKESAYKDQYDNVVNFVLTQPLQYMLGLAYVTPAKFEPALVEWMEQKMGNKSISRDDLYDWMKQACDILKPYAKSV